ncbi:CopM family metallochaperone [Tabrizicola soli]|uniref:DUF305 domain-containing protein n=1 Tax=Tabrizicola soli TaxID=2185115 RepID=A0ABV7E175_9RHOB|nr:DUF305 domain-containing protein [Tabrizicola soli]
MNRTALTLTLAFLAGLPAFAQEGHDTHHTGTPAEAPTAQMPAMPTQCQAMMQAMTPDCMASMQQMMQGMMQGMMAPAEAAANLPDFTRANLAAMDAMHGPMMDGVRAADPDVAFVRGMIPHHQGAIEMARIAQQYGNDPQVQEWAAQIIAAQEAEIAAMQNWLAAQAPQTPMDLGTGTVYSANEGGSSISAIDLSTGAVATVTLPLAPHNVDLTPDGKHLLAVGQPATGGHGGAAHGHDAEGGLLAILDPANLSAPAKTVPVGEHPAHVVADRAGRAFVSLSGANEVAVVDLAKAEVLARIPTGAYPHGLRLGPDQSQLYVANVEDGSVSLIDTASLAEVARIPVGEAPVQVGFTPSGAQVYVSLRDENRVAVIDTATREVTDRIDVGANPIQMAATPDGAFVYVANQGTEAAPDDTVSVIDAASGKVVKTITTGPGAHGVSVSADGAFVFVTNIAADSVSIIDTRAQEVVETVPVGDRPNGVVYGRPD